LQAAEQARESLAADLQNLQKAAGVAADVKKQARPQGRRPQNELADLTQQIGDAKFNRYTEPNADQRVLLGRLSLTLPPQLPPRITAAGHIARPGLPM